MRSVKITPSKLKGSVTVPPSKSMAHRAILCAALAKGISRIDNIAYSNDIIATIKAMESLGTKIIKNKDHLIIDGTTTYTKQDSLIDCVESGSTLRFMVPISIVKENQIHFIGEGNLGKRPLNTFYEIFDRQNIDYSYQDNVLDLKIKGQLKADHYKIPGNISSQFITGLLYALPLVAGDSVIEITSNLESKGYIDLTLQILKTFGIEIINENYEQFIIKGNQNYVSNNLRVEADFSQAAFYLVAGAIGNEVVLKDLNLNSPQGDKVAIDILKSMGAKIKSVEGNIQVVANELHGAIIDASQCPDIIPVISVACAIADGQSDIINAIRLRIKECDRIVATRQELNLLGANITEYEDAMKVIGVENIDGTNVSSHDDHRIAMMLAIASTICQKEIIIDNMDCVKKSYPNFWEDFVALGGKIDVINV